MSQYRILKHYHGEHFMTSKSSMYNAFSPAMIQVDRSNAICDCHIPKYPLRTLFRPALFYDILPHIGAFRAQFND